jgi:hypothetical protein
MALVVRVMRRFVLVVLGLVMRTPFLMGTVQAVVMAVLAAVVLLVVHLAAVLVRGAVRVRIGALHLAATGAACSAAFAVEALPGRRAVDVADGVLLLGQREDVRIAAGLRGAAFGVMLFVFFLVGMMSGTAHSCVILIGHLGRFG